MASTARAPLVLLSVCVFFAICTEVLPVSLLPQISDGLGASPSAAGILVSIYAVVVAVLSVPIAAVTERWPRRAVLTVLLAAYALSNILFACAPDYGVAVVARLLGGVAHAGFFAVAVAAAVSLADEAHAGRALTVIMVGNALALVLGIPLGTVLGAVLSWRAAFAVLAAAMGALALGVSLLLPETSRPRRATRTSVTATVRTPAVALVALVITLLALGHFTLYTYISPLLLHDGVARSDVGEVLLGYGAGGLIGVAVAGVLVARRPGAALTGNIVVMCASLALAAVATGPASIIPVVVLWGLAFGAFPTLTQAVMLRAAGDATDASAALVNATTNIGIAGGAFLGSRLLGFLAVPALGWVGAALSAGALTARAALGRRR